eukprot:767234-Hanusia_phi.AAC.1
MKNFSRCPCTSLLLTSRFLPNDSSLPSSITKLPSSVSRRHKGRDGKKARDRRTEAIASCNKTKTRVEHEDGRGGNISPCGVEPRPVAMQRRQRGSKGLAEQGEEEGEEEGGSFERSVGGMDILLETLYIQVATLKELCWKFESLKAAEGAGAVGVKGEKWREGGRGEEARAREGDGGMIFVYRPAGRNLIGSLHPADSSQT